MISLSVFWGLCDEHESCDLQVMATSHLKISLPCFPFGSRQIFLPFSIVILYKISGNIRQIEHLRTLLITGTAFNTNSLNYCTSEAIGTEWLYDYCLNVKQGLKQKYSHNFSPWTEGTWRKNHRFHHTWRLYSFL